MTYAQLNSLAESSLLHAETIQWLMVEQLKLVRQIKHLARENTSQVDHQIEQAEARLEKMKRDAETARQKLGLPPKEK